MQNHTDDIRLQKEKPHILLTLARVVFFGCAFFAVLFTVLYNMGGSNGTLKQGLEQFASRAFGGRPAYVERLNRMTFFPSIGFDAEGINVFSYPEASEYAVRIQKMRMAMSFFDVAFHAPRVKTFYLEGLNAKEGVIGRRSLEIEKVFIDHDASTKTAHLRANGKLDVHDWSVTLALNIFGGEGKFSYALAGRMPFSLRIADVMFDGVYVDHKGDYASLEDLVIKVGDKSYAGTATFQTVGHATLKTRGEFSLGDKGKTVSYDLLLDLAAQPVKITGEVSAHKFLPADMYGSQSVFASLNRVNDVLSRKVTDAEDFFAFLQPYDVDMNVRVADAQVAQGGVSDLEFSILQKQGMGRISGLKGRAGGQDFSAPVLHIVEEKDPNALRSVIFVLFQKGAFSPEMVKLWDAKLYDALFNNGNKAINIQCAAGSFVREGEQIKTENTYVDAGEGNVLGITGSYDLKTSRADLSIKASGDSFSGSIRMQGEAGGLALSSSVKQTVSKPAPMVLQGKNYDALSAVLLSNHKDDPCLPFIARAPEPVTEKKEDQGKALQENKSDKE